MVFRKLSILLLSSLLASASSLAQAQSTPTKPINEIMGTTHMVIYTKDRIYPPTEDQITKLCLESLQSGIDKCLAAGGEPCPGPLAPAIHIWEGGYSCYWPAGCFFRNRLPSVSQLDSVQPQ